MILSDRIKNFPIMMFAIVMGLSGLTIVYQKAALWLGFPSFIATLSVVIVTAIFAIIATLYGLKCLFFFEEVKHEFAHPIRINFFAAFSISLLLLSIVYHDIQIEVAQDLWYAGALIQTFLTFYTISFWITKNMEITHSNPAWFIPIVGNVIVPIGGFGFVDLHILIYFFSVGIFFWIILLPIIVNRIIFHHQLAQKFLPTLFILIAPPAVGVISYLKITEAFDLFASFLYSIALFFSFLLLFMIKNFLKLQFFISWWAFTFPLAAMTIASLAVFHTTHIPFYGIIASFLLIATTLVIAFVGYKTLYYVSKKEICIAE
ncbi:SLAC1 anion channel family protein [Sulfurospirillum sp. MES]|jgi:tellurite resistance protein|uniref:SLAC1 anion channel family protein n=1 Tax=Sulfurospirillum TaxID=57665 RepID=UPI00054444FC|nr:SLAC1 anion channel family protein [Sulfurospirillum sp. MES]KHG34653.1 MAG: C4-dicarboxylate ABC transporter [Sulfurospirillum sp. MES]